MPHFNIDHDRFVAKNRNMARGYEMDRKDRSMEEKGYSPLKRNGEASCFNCKMKSKCMEFKAKRTSGTKGAVSFGGDDHLICDRYLPAPAEQRSMSDKQIKSLLKNIKRKF